MPARHASPADPASRRPTAPGSSASGRLVPTFQRARLERRTVVIAVSAMAALWLLVVFAGALADASTQAARLQEARATNAALQARVDAGAVEIEAIQRRSFQDFLARAYGMGMPAERSFALAPDAPPPPSMLPLGEDPATARASTPFDDWLELLFGA